MKNEPVSGQVVYTNKAHCRDCYRCLRVCPVKAIKMENGQAYVVKDRCISCGTCIRECPQGAKQFRNDLDKAARIIESEKPVAVSVAPSFAAVYNEWERKRLPSALRRLGFSYVGETAVGAYFSAVETAGYCNSSSGKSHVCTACPAVVSYVEKYAPEHIGELIPVMSPMLAHARHIKVNTGIETAVVFVGPCVAKKSEAERPEYAGLVDCVLTFQELNEWFEREGIELSSCEESGFDEEPDGDARNYPLLGGSTRTANMSTDILSLNVVSASGYEEVTEALEEAASTGGVIIEPLFCPMGCINGPALKTDQSLYRRRRQVIDYALNHPGRRDDVKNLPAGLTTSFCKNSKHEELVAPEDKILEALEKTGKASLENQLNCGACGYPTCRDKAIAVVNGMAEPEMCIPYMKRLAEQRTDRIIETSPNGIVILDEHLTIISMNPAFKKFFMCSDAILGRPISYLMDPHLFEQLAAGKTDKIETIVRHDKYNLICHEILYALREEGQYVGILVNITKNKASKEQLEKLRSQTVLQARELLDHQINMAQSLAAFLGESTAKSESLVEKLMLIAGETSIDTDNDEV